MLAGSSPGIDTHSSGLGKGEASGAAAAEGSEAKAALPPFKPFSPAESGGDVRLKLRLARLSACNTQNVLIQQDAQQSPYTCESGKSASFGLILTHPRWIAIKF